MKPKYRGGFAKAKNNSQKPYTVGAYKAPRDFTKSLYRGSFAKLRVLHAAPVQRGLCKAPVLRMGLNLGHMINCTL